MELRLDLNSREISRDHPNSASLGLYIHENWKKDPPISRTSEITTKGFGLGK